MRELRHLHLIQRAVSVVGTAAFAATASLPALAQNSTRPGANQPGNSITQPGASETPSGSPSVPGASSVDDPGMAAPNSPRPNSPNARPGNSSNSPNAVPATPNGNASPTSPDRAAAAPGAIDQEFLTMAAQGNNTEIQMSQLALQRSDNAQVKEYAQMMVDQHTTANRQLEQLASQRNVTLPTTPTSLDAAVMAKLSQLSGTEFDKAYIDAQVNAHMKSMALYRTQIQQGEAQDLQQYAAQLLPSIQDHYEVASRMTSAQNAQQIR